MIRVVRGKVEGHSMEKFGYIKRRPILGFIILPVTRYLRMVNVFKYIDISCRMKVLDIGCGDGYFLKKLKNADGYGIDKLLGDDANKMDFNNSYFDIVTMLAVIEHITNPEKIIDEIYRVLKPGGKFIFTTPKESAEFFINLYVNEIEDEHEIYYDYKKVEELTKGKFRIVKNHNFIFGLNQVFYLEKI
jgi:ubiquinone/menaquinone biosynthesis C-methylase UbiE